MNQELEKIVSITRLRLQRKSPFFATLSLFTNCHFNDNIATAATDGKDIYLNPQFFLSLTNSEQEGLILHELLHAALLHSQRILTRNKELWNISADIVVNLMIKNEQHFTLPKGAIFPPSNYRQLGLKQEPEWDKLSVEEIYEILLKAPQNSLNSLNWSSNLFDLAPEGLRNGDSPPSSISLHDQAQLRSHWQSAMQQAIVVARTSNVGKLPAGIERQIAEISESQLDWRSYLWRYLVQTPNDFQGYDRRFVGRGLYLESLVGESVQVYVAIDTSGSIGGDEIKMFLGEVLGILNAYPHIQCYLYYADADLYGPYDINKHSEIPKPQGGGGTSFIPFFEAIEKERNFNSEGVCVYLTDGYGYFPQNKPSLPVLWVVSPGGLDLKQFPFGEAVRLLSV
jgi:predicted metal-dependent peptidase